MFLCAYVSGGRGLVGRRGEGVCECGGGDGGDGSGERRWIIAKKIYLRVTCRCPIQYFKRYSMVDGRKIVLTHVM